LSCLLEVRWTTHSSAVFIQSIRKAKRSCSTDNHSCRAIRVSYIYRKWIVHWMNTFKLMNLKRCTGTTNFNTASMRHGAQPVTSATTAKETRWKPPHPCNSRSVINCASILGAFSLIWLFPFRSLSSCGTREDLGPISLTPSKTRVIFSPAYFDAVSIVRWIKFHFSLIPSPPLCLSFSHSSIFPKYSFIFLFFFKSLSWDYLQLFFNWIEIH